jgi:hypothetical protein
MKRRNEHGWNWVNEITNKPVSYSYCPECLEEFRGEAGYTFKSPTLATACA